MERKSGVEMLYDSCTTTLIVDDDHTPIPISSHRSVFDTEPGCSGALRTGNWKHSVAQYVYIHDGTQPIAAPIPVMAITPIPHPSRCDTVLSTAAACDDQGNAWMWGAAAIDCGAHRLVSESWLRSIRGQRVVFVGDSTVRLLYTSFTRLAHGSGRCLSAIVSCVFHTGGLCRCCTPIPCTQQLCSTYAIALLCTPR